MKKLALIALLFAALGVISCNKDHLVSTTNSALSQASIEGKWNVVSDSTAGSIGPIEQITVHIYKGVEGDYFNFTAGGNLYAKEGDFLLDSAAYAVKVKQINLSYSYLFEGGVMVENSIGSYTVGSASEHSLILINELLGPGGYHYESLVLSK